jgi:hypothetical protein
MSMIHWAFIFDYAAFARELKSLLEAGLASGASDALAQFIHDNRRQLTDPYTEQPLPPSWEASLSPGDVQTYGFVALTKFYDVTDPDGEIGLWYRWDVIYDLLVQEAPGLEVTILGRACGSPSNYFDPGRMGTYFQSADLVRRNRARLQRLVQSKPALAPALVMLEKAATQGKGLYVRF